MPDFRRLNDKELDDAIGASDFLAHHVQHLLDEDVRVKLDTLHADLSAESEDRGKEADETPRI